MTHTHVVVGGGIAGLLAAWLLSQRANGQVMVVEREQAPGGLLRCFDYGEYGRFDYGMHNMYETGIGALDDFLFRLLPAEEWQLLEGTHRDLAGLVFQGRSQHHSPFPDLRALPREHWEACLAGLFRQLDLGPQPEADNAWDDAEGRFGTAIAQVIDEALRKQFGRPARALAPFAMRLTTLSRVVMFGETAFAQLIESAALRDRVAWPEQRTLPARWASGRRAYYPRRYGMYRVIDALLGRLREAGVEVVCSAQVQSLTTQGQVIDRLDLQTSNGPRVVESLGQLVWTSGLPPLAQLLGLPTGSGRFDPPRKTIVVNLLLRRPPTMGGLYYLYCYEPGCHTFRVTDFSAYCDGAPRAGGWPVAVELLMDLPTPDAARLKRITLDELARFGVIDADADVMFSAVEPLASGFPMPSVNNFRMLTELRTSIAERRLGNIDVLGILSEENVFFQRDVLAQTWARLADKEIRT